MGYVILESDDTLRLAAEVTQRMARGYTPLGGVACYYNPEDRTVRYAQAMVREPAGKAEPAAAPDRGRT
jgi:hypothetical protein